jgi:hypothetical protein
MNVRSALSIFLTTIPIVRAYAEDKPIELKKGEPVSSLTEPFGVSAALLGGGSAVTGDLSAVDFNPAGLSLTKELLVSGEVKWTQANTTAFEAGVQDSKMSDVAAGLKYRASTRYTGQKSRRFSLGFAQAVQDSGFIVGIGGDYRQVERTPVEREAGQAQFRESPRLRAGAIYRLSDSLILAGASDGWFDNYVKEKRHTLGLAVAFAQHYILNGDLIFKDSDPFETTFGLTVLAKEFLDLRVGYGYQLDSKRQKAAAGFTVKSQQFRLLYTISRADLRRSETFHQVAVGLTMAL